MAKARGSSSLPPVVVNYPRRMRPNKCYSAYVSWGGVLPRGDGPLPSVTVRMVVAGAQVLPAEQSLHPTDPRARAIFYITPLAKGWLRGERLEILVDGKKVQEVPLPAKAVTRRKAWTCLLLAFLVPWWLITFIQAPYQESKKRAQLHTPWTRHIDEWTPITQVENSISSALTSIGVNSETSRQVWEALHGAYNIAYWTIERDTIENPFSGSSEEGSPPVQEHVRLYLPFFSALFFLLLFLFFSWIGRERRKRRVSRPIPYGAARED